MPTLYRCETCGAVAESLDGWLLVSVSFLHMDTTQPLSGRMHDSTAPDLVFDKLECRQAWCKTADITDPGPVVTQPMRTP